MSIAVDKIVKVDLNVVDTESSAITGYETVVYLVKSDDIGGAEEGKVYNNWTEFNTAYGTSDTNGIAKSVEVFFDNGGNKIALYKYNKDTLDTILNNICSNHNDCLYIVASNNAISSSADIKAICEKIDNIKAPLNKRLVITTSNKQTINDLSDYGVVAFYTKLKAQSTNSNVLDIGLLVGSHTSRIALDGSATVTDICYTPVTIKLQDSTGKTYEAFDDLTDEEMGIPSQGTLFSKGSLASVANFVSKVGNRILLFGGNLTNGVGIDTDFGCMAVENDIANALVDVMTQKQYLTQQGLQVVLTRIKSLLTRYQTNGYVEMDSTYTGANITKIYNGRKFSIITNGTPMPAGFLVTAVPMNAITQKDRLERRFTPIYVVMQTQKGARVVEVSGTVI